MYAITSVQRALSEDVDGRLRRYAFSMIVRTVCVIIAILAPAPWNWVSLAGAVVIPIVAVLVANAGRELPAAGGSEVDPWGLPAGPSGGAGPGPAGGTWAGGSWAGGTWAGVSTGAVAPTDQPARRTPAAWTDDPTAEYLR